MLRNCWDARHAALYAVDAIRTQTALVREAVSEPATRRRMHEVDADRALYLRQAYGTDWRDTLQYTLPFNTGVLRVCPHRRGHPDRRGPAG